MAKRSTLPKAVVLCLAVALMLPIATSWQSMFGSVHRAIGHSITADSAQAEKDRLEEEMREMLEQMEKLEALIERLENQ